jgi:hypothetical protein
MFGHAVKEGEFHENGGYPDGSRLVGMIQDFRTLCAHVVASEASKMNRDVCGASQGFHQQSPMHLSTHFACADENLELFFIHGDSIALLYFGLKSKIARWLK